MNPIKTKKRPGHYKELLYKALVFTCTVLLIVYFLPRDGRFNYQFDIDKPWKYGQLMATFDFPIYKPDSLVKHEQDSMLATFSPYYRLDRQVEQEALEKLQANYEADLRRLLTADQFQRLKEALTDVYHTGIIATDDLHTLQKDSTSSILIVDDKIAQQQSTAKLHSVKEAYTALLATDPTRFKPELLQQCALNDYLSPNLSYDRQRTESARKELLDNYSWANGFVQSGQKIIDRGEIVGPETYRILESLQKESIKRSTSLAQQRLMLAGQLLYTGILIGCFMLYLQLFRKEYYERKANLTLLFLLITIYCVLTATMVANNFFTIYIIPYAMLPVIIRVFLDSRTAFLTQVVTILLCSICLRYPHEFILLQIPASLVAIFSLRELSQRSQLFRTAIMVTLTYFAVYFAFELITENDLSKLDRGMYVYFVINGALLLFTYPLLFLLEKLFRFTSNVTLVELSNINTPLLRRLSETVPGTFQHSMQVANLAAEAANRIGANSQLVRTGALYHDIGKMENPVFFTENQSAGVNPHKNLTFEESARIVINHVTNGIKLAEKHNLPDVIKAFITTHHGHGKTKYFYISWKNGHDGEEPDEALFTYPGPNPTTREQAILMMADAVEAASRSLSAYTEESISGLVEKIIDSQVADGYYKECPITYKDIATIKAVFKEKLKTIYHTRISYPELKKS
ncbi:MAG: HDIG domain-containing protein [Prevotellaceae bacterium]|nr:HDIG domain-containing protein [Prevotellaceae bacterium]